MAVILMEDPDRLQVEDGAQREMVAVEGAVFQEIVIRPAIPGVGEERRTEVAENLWLMLIPFSIMIYGWNSV